MKIKFFTLILFYFININAQKNSEIKLIKSFINDIYNCDLDSKEIVDKYLEIIDDKENSISLKDRKVTAEKIIEKIRDVNTEKNKLIPKISLDSIKKFNIYPFKDYENLNEYKFSGINLLRKDSFVLLNDKKDRILQYFLLNNEHSKVISFSLFVKSDIAWFFSY